MNPDQTVIVLDKDEQRREYLRSRGWQTIDVDGEERWFPYGDRPTIAVKLFAAFLIQQHRDYRYTHK